MDGFKVIVFDMDGTLYDLADVQGFDFEMETSFLARETGVSEETAAETLLANHIYPVRRKESASATEFFKRIGLDSARWSEYRVARFDASLIDPGKAATAALVADFARMAKTVLLTNNSQANVTRLLERIAVPLDAFDVIVCSDGSFFPGTFSKSRAFEAIAAHYGAAYQELLSVGDRYEIDLAPLLRLGGCGYLVERPAGLWALRDKLAAGDYDGILFGEAR